MKNTAVSFLGSSRTLTLLLGSVLAAALKYTAPWLAVALGAETTTGLAYAAAAVFIVPVERWWQHKKLIMALEEKRLKREIEGETK